MPFWLKSLYFKDLQRKTLIYGDSVNKWLTARFVNQTFSFYLKSLFLFNLNQNTRNG
jgi:hypothetical protein